MTIIAVLLLFGVCASVVAKKRGGNEIAWFFAGLLLGPIGWALAFTVDNHYRCPFCREAVRPEATRCPRCQSALAGKPAPTPVYSRTQSSVQPPRFCRTCGQPVASTSRFCAGCGAAQGPMTQSTQEPLCLRKSLD
jgi:hypothetical protein